MLFILLHCQRLLLGKHQLLMAVCGTTAGQSVGDTQKLLSCSLSISYVVAATMAALAIPVAVKATSHGQGVLVQATGHKQPPDTSKAPSPASNLTWGTMCTAG
jgi:hypothetical protein